MVIPLASAATPSQHAAAEHDIYCCRVNIRLFGLSPVQINTFVCGGVFNFPPFFVFSAILSIIRIG